MKINKQNNIYTIVYITILVIVVGAVLAITSMALKDKQLTNADADKMKQILASVHVKADDNNVVEKYNQIITETLVVDAEGKVIGHDAFDVNVQEQAKIKDIGQRMLPVYICTLADNEVKYIVPVAGNGLWGPIWGYISLNQDGKTIYGAYFAHQSETPGLGAEIEKPDFCNQFDGKQIFKNDRFMPVAVIKKGQKAPNGEDFVDAKSGATITSKGVGAMISDCLSPYEAYLKKIGDNKAETHKNS